mmetsp:Transcript_39451/g.82495  ORF Transcript_39451/g.82495 Transcript_39451/m.82495 type:complete len:106 (+) Transcript_39451:118-435(+)
MPRAKAKSRFPSKTHESTKTMMMTSYFYTLLVFVLLLLGATTLASSDAKTTKGSAPAPKARKHELRHGHRKLCQSAGYTCTWVTDCCAGLNCCRMGDGWSYCGSC